MKIKPPVEWGDHSEQIKRAIYGTKDSQTRSKRLDNKSIKK